MLEQTSLQFPGSDLGHEDMRRLGRQRTAVWAVMLTGRWMTLAELEEATGYPQASLSARLRDFRRPKYGGHTVERRRRYGAGTGTWEYKLTVAG